MDAMGGKANTVTHGRRFLCGVPSSNCCANFKQMHDKNRKLHTTARDAYRCAVSYYLSLGYTEGQNHVMIPPDDKPVVMLPKQSKMPATRPGKAGRWMFRYNCEIG